MGRLLEYVLAHEVGHTIGFQHNMKASSQYPIDSIRNADFLRRMGHVSTLMDYSRFNYVVQPEDHIRARVARSRRSVRTTSGRRTGATRRSARRCRSRSRAAQHTGAELIAGAEAKRKTLDEWAREQDTKPWLRFSTSRRVRLGSGRRDRSRWRHRSGARHGARHQEPQAQHAVDRERDA